LLLLFIFNVIHLAVNWVFTRDSYIINGTTRDDVFLAFENEVMWQNMLSATVNAASTLVADAIIVRKPDLTSLNVSLINCRSGESGLFGAKTGE
jgi:hypothetical protein